MTNREKLVEASRLLTEVAGDMDASTKVCACCQFRVKNNWPQHLLHDNLLAKVRAIERMLGYNDGRIERGWQWFGGPQPSAE